MIKIKFPEFNYRIRKENEQDSIFDPVRKQWVALTDEEWVRQNFIRFLVQEMKYPETLIAVEKEIQLGELKKRFDILVYDKQHLPWMLVECKSPDIALDDKVFQQVLRYHISIPCTFLVITNGQYTAGWEKVGGELKEIMEMPSWV